MNLQTKSKATFWQSNDIATLIRVATVLLLSLGLLAGLLCATEESETPKQLETGIYSDMHFNQDGGDVIGIEVFLLYSVSGYHVVFQASEGEPCVPVVLKAKVQDSLISFTIPEGVLYEGEFAGWISEGKLHGNITGYSGYASSLNLVLGLSYWQKPL
ncbi:MAG: hypothetical protein AAB305_06110 [Candidatus Zixiibacteriota bacterium]